MDMRKLSSIIPAAGRGSRMYPLTRSVPKELLPLVDCPCIMHILAEGQRAGIDTFHVITSPSKPALREFFTMQPGEEPLQKDGLEMPQVDFINQDEPLGLGHAVLQARTLVGDNPFVVQLPDDIFHPEDPLLETLLKVHSVTAGCVVALMKVSPQEANRYSSAAITPVALDEDIVGGHEVFQLSDIIEKPAADQVRSSYALMGRYVLSPGIFEILEATPPGYNHEIQLTDALAAFSQIPPAEGGGVWGVVSAGRHFDTGNLLGYLAAQTELALEHPQLGDPLRQEIRRLFQSSEGRDL